MTPMQPVKGMKALPDTDRMMYNLNASQINPIAFTVKFAHYSTSLTFRSA